MPVGQWEAFSRLSRVSQPDLPHGGNTTAGAVRLMAQFPFMPLFTDAWVADTFHLSVAARGAYMDLLVLMWRTPGCCVPNDVGWLMPRLRITKDEYRELLQPVIA